MIGKPQGQGFQAFNYQKPQVQGLLAQLFQKPQLQYSRGFLRVNFDDLLSTVGPRSQLESCSIMNLVCPMIILATLGQWNDQWKEFSENRSVLATRTGTGNCATKNCDFGKVSNWKVVGIQLIQLWSKFHKLWKRFGRVTK